MASSSTTGPRPRLMKTKPSLAALKASALIIPRVDIVDGAEQTT
eukprot:CAMPEP_0178583402 /NCGR_PEP_ID=MMETSP0697-20121206/24239_1 /TAXON_ID=265572 /ORGANISM="Extubocellulus spinifer, Strain CCMP396" /LENGTH=43 /DNA_ID= /DNA_START= /DNA_END= /DNA_ORIENTATION=